MRPADAVLLARLRSRTDRKDVRVRAGLSLAEIAAACRVSPSTVQRWERAEATPHGTGALAYATVLDALDELCQT